MANTLRSADMAKRICTVEGCGRPHEAQGLCANHYMRAKHHGTITLNPARNMTLEEKFWYYTIKTPSGHWYWSGPRSRGYGLVFKAGKARMAHRFGYELLVGPVPDDMQIDHLCRIKWCVNPQHLQPVTPKVNVLRSEGVAARKARRTTCPQGHPYDIVDRNGYRMCRECKRRHGAATRARRRQRKDAA